MEAGGRERSKYLFLNAGVIPTFIWVIFLSVNPIVIYDKSKCIVHKSAVAAVVWINSVTINQLLFREADERSCDNLVDTFDGTSS